VEDTIAALRHEIVDEDPAPGACFGHGAALAGSRDETNPQLADAALAVVEHRGHDEVFLVGEVALEEGQ
jgi:hypothetical protein